MFFFVYHHALRQDFESVPMRLFVFLLLFLAVLTGCSQQETLPPASESPRATQAPGTSPDQTSGAQMVESDDPGVAGSPAAARLNPGSDSEIMLLEGSANPEESETKDLTASDYPWWRGMSRADQYGDQTVAPLQWGEEKNIAWKTPIPGLGHGTPTIVKDRIFLGTSHSDPKDKKRVTVSLLILDRKTGKQLKEVKLYTGAPPRVHKDNSNASATIACDGSRLYFPFLLDETVWLYCCDWEGNIVWKKDLGKFVSAHGFSCSPLLYRDLVILCQDPEGPTWGYLTAMNRKTGQTVWRIQRTKDHGFGSPCLVHTSGKDQLIVNGPHVSRSYDPATGKQYWRVQGPTQVCPSSPAWDDQAVYLSGGWPRKSILGVRSDGSGDVSATHMLWKNPREVVPSYVPSLAQKDGILYCLDDYGTFSVLDAKTGSLHWKEKLPEQFYSSPVLVGNRVYLFGRSGTCWIFKTGKEQVKLGENTLGKGVWANPVFLDDGIYVRSLDTLYFIK